MTYHYKGKTITLNDRLIKKYEAFTGSSFTDLDIEYLLRVAKREQSGVEINTLSETELSDILTEQMKNELSY